MKIRIGFVSNSSSSSFIIFHKGSEEELKNDLVKVFALPEGYPIKKLDLGKIFYNKAHCDAVVSTEEGYRNHRDEYGYDDVDEEELSLIKDGFFMYRAEFFSDSDPLECFLYDIDIGCKTEKLIIKKEY